MWEHLHGIYAAFHELTTERQSGMGLGQIPASKIRKYARKQLGIWHEDDAERFFVIVRQMDDEYLTLNNSSSKPSAQEIAPDDEKGVVFLFQKLEARNKNPSGKPKPK